MYTYFRAEKISLIKGCESEKFLEDKIRELLEGVTRMRSYYYYEVVEDETREARCPFQSSTY
jgi:hypothetical protein